jgi:hypothetical protein
MSSVSRSGRVISQVRSRFEWTRASHVGPALTAPGDLWVKHVVEDDYVREVIHAFNMKDSLP